jgi:hypothetical protein
MIKTTCFKELSRFFLRRIFGVLWHGRRIGATQARSVARTCGDGRAVVLERTARRKHVASHGRAATGVAARPKNDINN